MLELERRTHGWMGQQYLESPRPRTHPQEIGNNDNVRNALADNEVRHAAGTEGL